MQRLNLHHVPLSMAGSFPRRHEIRSCFIKNYCSAGKFYWLDKHQGVGKRRVKKTLPLESRKKWQPVIKKSLPVVGFLIIDYATHTYCTLLLSHLLWAYWCILPYSAHWWLMRIQYPVCSYGAIFVQHNPSLNAIGWLVQSLIQLHAQVIKILSRMFRYFSKPTTRM